MQEGILSLMQMPRTTIAVQKLREAGLPYIVVLTDPTHRRLTAPTPSLGDIQIAEPGALICFAGPASSSRPSASSCLRASRKPEYSWRTA